MAINLFKGLPETQSTIADSQFGSVFETSVFYVKQDLGPGQLAFSQSVSKGQELFFAVFCCSNDDQEALSVFHAYIAVDAISPNVCIALMRQIPFLLVLQVLFPDAL